MIQKNRFIFAGHEWLPEKGEARFAYQIHQNNEVFDFVETITFPTQDQAKDIPKELLHKLLDNLSLILGISYYKLFCPKEIALEGNTLSEKQAEFWNTVYTKGLGELFYKNQIDFRGLISFPFSDSLETSSIPFVRQDRSLVGIGGGKDSIVSAELLKAHKKPFTSFMLNRYPLQEEVSKIIGHDQLVVERHIDPKLFDLNKREDTYNGHIPISAIYAFIGLFTAVVYDYRFVVVSNEHTASYGNVDYLGMEINHQWSKSLEFEGMLQDYVSTFITKDVVYFSLLRQLTEIGIVKRFVNYPTYFLHFSSCNRNFKITGEGPSQKWCGECAKCAFAFVMLAACLPKEDVVGIFGQDFLAKEDLVQTYKELLGVVNIKPFDCVGTPDEVRVAFYLASKKGDYDIDVSMSFFQKDVLPEISNIDELEKQIFQKVETHRIPKEFEGVV